MIQCRNDLPQFLSGVGVEIGVHLGDYSDILLRKSKLTYLVSIDPWLKDRDLYPTQNKADAAYESVKQRLAVYGSRSCVLRTTGQEASRLFLSESLDFIYIDSSHEYQETVEELMLWWPKLRPNGLLAGHDYCNGIDVKNAVDTFATSKGLLIVTTVQDSAWKTPVNSWMIRKPIA